MKALLRIEPTERKSDTFRGAVDPAQYKDYILVMLFLKYISDLWNDHMEKYRKQFGHDDARIRRRLQRETMWRRTECSMPWTTIL